MDNLYVIRRLEEVSQSLIKEYPSVMKARMTARHLRNLGESIGQLSCSVEDIYLNGLKVTYLGPTTKLILGRILKGESDKDIVEHFGRNLF